MSKSYLEEAQSILVFDVLQIAAFLHERTPDDINQTVLSEIVNIKKAILDGTLKADIVYDTHRCGLNMNGGTTYKEVNWEKTRVSRENLIAWTQSLGISPKFLSGSRKIHQSSSWTDIEMNISDNGIVIITNSKTNTKERVPLSDIGLTNKSQPSKPTKSFELLTRFSKNINVLKGNEAIRKDIYRLNNKLREYFNIDAIPITLQGNAYVPQFCITNSVLKNDKRAKDKADRFNSSYDDVLRQNDGNNGYSFDEEDDPAGDFLKTHDQ